MNSTTPARPAAAGARASFLIGASAMVLVLAGCGGSTPAATGQPTGTSGVPTAVVTQPAAVVATSPVTNGPTAGSSNVEACSLLTVAEVAATSDYALDLATPDSDDLYSYCKYTAPRGGGEVSTFVTKSAATASSYFATIKINTGQAVTGVGDDAFWSTDSFQPGLYFLKGGLLAYISGAQSGPEDSIINLGKLMASRM